MGFHVFFWNIPKRVLSICTRELEVWTPFLVGVDWLRRQSTHSLLLPKDGVASYSDLHSFGEGKSVAAVSGRETHIHSPRSVPVLEEEQNDSADSNVHHVFATKRFIPHSLISSSNAER